MQSLSKNQRLSVLQKGFRKFFRDLLKEYGVLSPSKLGAKETKTEFFTRIKEEWPAAKEALIKATLDKVNAPRTAMASDNKEKITVSKGKQSKGYHVDAAKLMLELCGGGMSASQTAKAMRLLHEFNEKGKVKVNGFTISKDSMTSSTMFAFGDEEEEDDNTIFARDLDVDVLLSGSSAYDYLIEAYDAEQDYDEFESVSSAASVEARKMKLKYFGYGKWGDASSRKVTHHVIHGKLVPVKEAKIIKRAAKAIEKVYDAAGKHKKNYDKYAHAASKARLAGDLKGEAKHWKTAMKHDAKFEKAVGKEEALRQSIGKLDNVHPDIKDNIVHGWKKNILRRDATASASSGYADTSRIAMASAVKRVPSSLKQQMVKVADSARKAGQYVQIDRSVDDEVYVFRGEDDDYTLRHDEARALLNEVPPNVSAEDYILWSAQGW